MATMQELDKFKALPAGEKLFVFAISIVSDRVARLDEADRADLWTLLKELSVAKTSDDQEGIVQSMLEIIDGDNAELVEQDLGESALTEGGDRAEIIKWREWVGGKVKAARQEANLTQDDLAAKSGLPQSHISRIENGKHSPARATIEKLATALGKPVSYFDCNA